MLNKLISLVFLLFFLLVNKAYAENEFILPAQKPSIFKKIEKIDTVNTNLPQKKPIKKSSESSEEKEVKKPAEKKESEQKVQKKDEKKKEIKQISSVFIFPQKKPITYKTTSERGKKIHNTE